MRVREPRDALLPFLLVWSGLFGGVPLVMLAVLPKGSAPAFLLLFPLVAAAVLSIGVRRSRRSGFHLTADGLHGAHDDEGACIAWEDVRRLAWRTAPDTSGVSTNGRSQPPGDALFLQRTDGRWVRVMQRVARSQRVRARIDRDLARAVAAGLLPVPVPAAVDEHQDVPLQQLDGPGTVTWRPTPPDERHTWAPPAVAPPAPPTAQATDDTTDGAADEPYWPTA